MKLYKVRNRSVRTLAEDYLKQLELQNKSPLTILNYRTDLHLFLVWFEKSGENNLEKAQADTINKYLSYLKGQLSHPRDQESPKKKFPALLKDKFLSFFKKKTKKVEEIRTLLSAPYSRDSSLSPGSIRRHISVLRNFFEFLRQKHEDLPGKDGKKFEKNPIKNKLHQIQMKDTDINHTLLLTAEDFQNLDFYAHHPIDRVLIHILYYGGLRLAEAASLSFSNFDMNEGCAEFVRKGGDRHLLYFHQFDSIKKEIFKLQNKEGRKEGPLFLSQKSKKGLTARALAYRLEKLFLKATVSKGVAPHSFRKARATELYLETKDLLYVRDYLNHSDAKVTQTYIDKKALHSMHQKEFKKIEGEKNI